MYNANRLSLKVCEIYKFKLNAYITEYKLEPDTVKLHETKGFSSIGHITDVDEVTSGDFVTFARSYSSIRFRNLRPEERQ